MTIRWRRLLDDVRGYVAFIFDRAPTLERMSGEFERTPAGLQHAAHLYEGENKFLGTRLDEILTKHHTVIDSPAAAPVTRDFVVDEPIDSRGVRPPRRRLLTRLRS